MADDLGIMLTELPEAESISDNDLLYLVKENNSEKVKGLTLKNAVNKIQVPEVISTADKAAYVRRQIPTTGALAEGQKIIGATLAWNQLVQNGNFVSTSGWNTNTSYGSIATSSNVLTYTIINTSPSFWHNQVSTNIVVPSNHKALIKLKVKPKYSNKVGVYVDNNMSTSASKEFNNLTANEWNELSCIFTINGGITRLIVIFDTSSNYAVNDTIQIQVVNAIDLTQLFGSTIADAIYQMEQTTAGSGVAFFRQYFPEDYYNDDAGSLQSVNVSAHKAVGKNKLGCTLTALKTRNSTATWTDNKALINGVTFTVNTTSDGYISDISASGTAVTGNSQLMVPIDSNSVNGNVYYVAVYNGGTSTFHAYVWDSTTNSRAKQWNGTTNVYDSTNGTLQQLKIIKGHTVEIPLRVMASQTANNWMFYPMITSPTETDATFKPYWQTNVILDSSKEFRGLYQLVSGELRADGDVYESDGTVTRKYGMAILDGSDDENWSVSGNNKRVNSNYLNNSKYFPVSTVANIISSRFNAVTAENTYNGIRGISLSDTLNVSDGSGNMNLNDWKTNLSTNPLVVVYELATPTTETATPYTNPQIVDADGTEEFVDYKVSQGTRDVAIPVGHESSFYDYTDGAITIPDLPFADGTYALSVTMNNGTPTFSWESNS